MRYSLSLFDVCLGWKGGLSISASLRGALRDIPPFLSFFPHSHSFSCHSRADFGCSLTHVVPEVNMHPNSLLFNSAEGQQAQLSSPSYKELSSASRGARSPAADGTAATEARSGHRVSLGLHEGTEDCLHDPTAFPLPALTSSLVLLF